MADERRTSVARGPLTSQCLNRAVAPHEAVSRLCDSATRRSTRRMKTSPQQQQRQQHADDAADRETGTGERGAGEGRVTLASQWTRAAPSGRDQIRYDSAVIRARRELPVALVFSFNRPNSQTTTPRNTPLRTCNDASVQIAGEGRSPASGRRNSDCFT